MIFQKRRVRFSRPGRPLTTAALHQAIGGVTDQAASDMAQSDDDFEPFMAVPPHLCQWPPIQDQWSTYTSELQGQTITECLPLLTAVNSPTSNPFDFDEHGLPSLHRQAHVEFVHNGLEPLPAPFVAMDASRPWLMYWSLLSLHIMGEDVTAFRSRYVDMSLDPYLWQGGTNSRQDSEDFSTLTERVRRVRRRARPPFASGRNIRSNPSVSHGWWRRSIWTR